MMRGEAVIGRAPASPQKENWALGLTGGIHCCLADGLFSSATVWPSLAALPSSTPTLHSFALLECCEFLNAHLLLSIRVGLAGSQTDVDPTLQKIRLSPPPPRIILPPARQHGLRIKGRPPGKACRRGQAQEDDSLQALLKGQLQGCVQGKLCQRRRCRGSRTQRGGPEADHARRQAWPV